jgi:hypothetical protein
MKPFELVKGETMKKLMCIALLLMLAGLYVPAGGAQESEKAKPAEKAEKAPGGAYRLDFVINEIEDSKKVNSRSYSMQLEAGNWGKLRVGSRIPIRQENRVTYMDVGLSLDCRVYEEDLGPSLDLRLEMNSFAIPEQDAAANPGTPPLRNFRSETKSAVSLGKPVVVATADDMASKRRFQVEVTATKVK